MVRNPEDMLSHDAAHTDCQTNLSPGPLLATIRKPRECKYDDIKVQMAKR